MLLNPTDFIKHSGKTRAAMYRALKAGRIHKNNDGLIDTEHPDSIAYCESNRHNKGVGSGTHGLETVTASPTVSGAPKRVTRTTRASAHRGKSRAELDAEKVLQSVVKLELENEIKMGNYIPKDLVEEKIIVPIDEFLIKMLADLPRTLVMAVRASIEAGMTNEEAEVGATDILESHVKRLKIELKRGLK